MSRFSTPTRTRSMSGGVAICTSTESFYFICGLWRRHNRPARHAQSSITFSLGGGGCDQRWTDTCSSRTVPGAAFRPPAGTIRAADSYSARASSVGWTGWTECSGAGGDGCLASSESELCSASEETRHRFIGRPINKWMKSE